MYLGYYSNLCIGLGSDECFSLGTMRGGKRIYNKYLLLHFVRIVGTHIGTLKVQNIHSKQYFCLYN